MKQAQAAWAALSAVFVIAGAIVAAADDDPTTTPAFAIACLVVGIVGWTVLTAMILWDARQ